MAFEENVPLPKINKIPFIVFDAVLLLFAAVIVFRSDWPLTPLMFMGSLFLVAMGGVVACLPFLIEFRTAAKLKEYDLSQANTENARRIESAMMGIQEIGESVIQATDRSAEICGAFETLLERMESRIKEIKAGGGEASLDSEQLKEALGTQFETARDEFAQAIAEQVAMTSDKQHDKLNSALSKLQGLPMQVSLLGDLAARYQGLMAMMQDTAAQLVESTPTRPEPKVEVAEALEGSFDGVLDEEDEENVAPETVAIVEHEVADEDELEDYTEAVIDEEPESEEDDEVEVIDELIEVDVEEPLTEDEEVGDDFVDEVEGPTDEAEDFDIASSLPAEDEDQSVDGEDFSQMDARFEEELENSAEPEPESEETVDEAKELLDEELSEEEPAEAEPEFLSDEDLAEAEPEPDAMPEMSEAALAELEEEDFDIALSDDLEESEEVEAVAEEAESEEEPADEAALVDAEVSGMGFDDWDEFGEIATEEDVEESPDEEPEQGELIEGVAAEPKSKPKKQRGATTLIAQVLIGIGNKPYVRGTGPGLSMDAGVAMEFLEIGKWQWTAPSSDEPVTVYIYKNDEDCAEGDPIEIPAGQRRSVAPKFPK
ncbi:hypothetical protein [Cerasicoccus maritimus]|uniref:hypothetical protein n=1 Tax=Cerasicoccus maritimus TaxID=490089 RepID=UPI0028525861|nr:hypothetical protein [Cerasicoccus maritimus]